MILTRAGLMAVLMLSGPFSNCNDDPPTIPPIPKYLDSGVTGDSKPDDLAPPKQDKEIPDLAPPADKWVSTLGKTCTASGGQCVGGEICVFVTSKTAGVCSEKCDPSKYPLVPNGCRPQWECGRLPGVTSGNIGYCFGPCTLSPGKNSCQAGVACHPGNLVGHLGDGLCLGPPTCAKASDCPVRTATACTVGGGTKCPSGQLCHPVILGLPSGHCALPGVCDKVSGLCLDHKHGKAAAKVGDACASDTECGGAMTCMMERDEKVVALGGGKTCTDGKQCCSGTCTSGKCLAGPCRVYYRNGYCTLKTCGHAKTWPARACPTGSTCNRWLWGGRCQKTCNLTVASQCRGQAKDKYGDYECRAWDSLSVSGNKVADKPVCDFGLAMTCDLLASSKLDCSAVGIPKTNATNMLCRGLDGAKLAAGSPAGFCLDDTASGSKKR